MKKNVAIMAFDFGLKRIGVALANTETDTTHPLETVEGKNNQAKLEKISKLLKTWDPDLILVGAPSHADGSEHELWEDVLRFAKRLRALSPKPIFFVNESYSSGEAENKLKEIDIRGEGVKPYLDRVAAQGIAESFLVDGMGVPYVEGMRSSDLGGDPVKNEF